MREAVIVAEASDVRGNRRARKWSVKVQFLRLAWAGVRPVFRLVPRPLWGVRRALLRAFGARIGVHAHIYPSVRITMPWNVEIGDYAAVGDRVIVYALGRIRVGNCVTVSQGAHLCGGTHDHRDPAMPLVRAPVTIGDGAWICADAFVGPNVDIGSRAIVGARAVAVRNVAADTIVAGNPARKVGVRAR